MAKTTREVADALKLKSREVTNYAKKYGLLPLRSFGKMPMWEHSDVDLFTDHRREMIAGMRCKECGQKNPGTRAEDAEVIATDEPGEVEG